jgi:adenylate cyclase
VIRLRLFLTLGVAVFVIVVVAGVGGLGVFGTIENALAVKREFQAYRAETVSRTVRDYFERIEAEARVVASLAALSPGLTGDDARVVQLLSALVGNLEGVRDATLLRPDRTNVMVFLDGDEVAFEMNGALDSEAYIVMAAGRADPDSEGYEDLYMEPVDRRPVTTFTLHLEDAAGLSLGTLFIDIDILALTDAIAVRDAAEDSYLFMIDNRGVVMAHHELAGGAYADTLTELPRAEHLADPLPAAILAHIRRTNEPPEQIETPRGPFLITMSRLPGLGDSEWLVVSAVHRDMILGEAYDRARLIGVIGLVVLIVAVALSLWVGRLITSPVLRLASAADAIQEFDLTLPAGGGSRFMELDRAERAFSAMLRGLRVFSRYVPKTLVRRLIQMEEAGATIEPEDRVVTILFTDIAGFTKISSGMAPDRLAAMLNEYFGVLVGAVLREEGTVDKFIGDALMVFWNAPLRQEDHADRAIRAALAIRAATEDFNRGRAERGEPELHTRIGLHTGTVLVGDIGTEERLNYTIVGDPVNTAARLEALGKEVGCFLCISEEARAAASEGYAWRRLDAVTLRGRAEETVVYTIEES